MRHVNSAVENLKALIDNEFTTIRRSFEDLKRKNFITDNMSLIASLKEEVAYLRKENIIKTEIIKSLTVKKVVAPVFLKNENPNNEFNISSANNEKISRPKISTENEYHRANSSLLGKENNKDKEKKMMKKRNQN